MKYQRSQTWGQEHRYDQKELKDQLRITLATLSLPYTNNIEKIIHSFTLNKAQGAVWEKCAAKVKFIRKNFGLQKGLRVECML